uniref:Uncharacterized protein n=1 Tax=Cairina moschata TaxID=8855 RepID=A0A8C3CHG0_CAIMO
MITELHPSYCRAVSLMRKVFTLDNSMLFLGFITCLSSGLNNPWVDSSCPLVRRTALHSHMVINLHIMFFFCLTFIPILLIPNIFSVLLLLFFFDLSASMVYSWTC